MLHLVEEILSVEPYKIVLKFNTGEVKLVDLAEKLDQWAVNPKSKFAELKDFKTFKNVSIQEDFHSLVWENGIDLCPDVLHNLGHDVTAKQLS